MSTFSAKEPEGKVVPTRRGQSRLIRTGRSKAGSILVVVAHIEWWAEIGTYQSFTTCLYWVFNQTVISWVCTLVMINERDVRSYFLLFVCCFLSGPFPACGLAVLMLARGIGELVLGDEKGKALLAAMRDVCSPASIAPLLLLVPVAVYLLSNSWVSNAQSALADAGNILPPPLWFPLEPKYMLLTVGFFFLEVLPLPLLILRHEKRNPLFWGMCAMFAISPLCSHRHEF